MQQKPMVHTTRRRLAWVLFGQLKEKLEKDLLISRRLTS